MLIQTRYYSLLILTNLAMSILEENLLNLIINLVATSFIALLDSYIHCKIMSNARNFTYLNLFKYMILVALLVLPFKLTQ